MIRKVLGGFAWVLLAALLIVVNAVAGPHAMPEHSNVSMVK